MYDFLTTTPPKMKMPCGMNNKTNTFMRQMWTVEPFLF